MVYPSGWLHGVFVCLLTVSSLSYWSDVCCPRDHDGACRKVGAGARADVQHGASGRACTGYRHDLGTVVVSVSTSYDSVSMGSAGANAVGILENQDEKRQVRSRHVPRDASDND